MECGGRGEWIAKRLGNRGEAILVGSWQELRDVRFYNVADYIDLFECLP